MAAAQAGDVDLHVPYQVREVSGNGTIERVKLFHSDDETHEIEIEVDAILLQLGFKTAPGAWTACRRCGGPLTHTWPERLAFGYRAVTACGSSVTGERERAPSPPRAKGVPCPPSSCLNPSSDRS
jgi:hypothetical protein